ncbi:MAG: prepilin-type N-terminal cleavage/methylation domain-containing protein [Sedimentisphaerales bacterium]|nr:prepilin-type N-terminal cleavage/methylation domain-containing protein [Sedimentisphaerales bacterium]
MIRHIAQPVDPNKERRKSYSGHSSFACGFSLIEVLVVITILIVLLTISANVLREVQEQSKAAICASHVRELGRALIVYAESNERFPYGLVILAGNPNPPPGGDVGTTTADLMGWWWFHLVDEEIGGVENQKDKLLRCPARKVQDIGITDNLLCGNYGINQAIARSFRGDRSLGFVGEPLRSDEIPHISRSLLLVDSGYSLISWRAVASSEYVQFDNPFRLGAYYLPGLKSNGKRSILSEQRQDALGGRHPKQTVNVGYADGSVSRCNAESLKVEREGEEENLRFINRSPLWMPSSSETH